MVLLDTMDVCLALMVDKQLLERILSSHIEKDISTTSPQDLYDEYKFNFFSLEYHLHGAIMFCTVTQPKPPICHAASGRC